MKLAFSTLGCPDWSLEQIIENAKSMGFHGIEIRGINGEMRLDKICAFQAKHVENTKYLLAKKQIQLCGLDTSVVFDNEDVFNSSIEEGIKAIDICALLGVDNIRVFGDSIPESSNRDNIIQRVSDGINILCDYAREKQVCILLETHGDFNTIENLTAVIEKIKNISSFGLIWDIAHTDAVYGKHYKMFYNEFKPYIKRVHIKDHIVLNEQKVYPVLAGKGIVPVRDIVETLISSGFDGYYSFEWEKKWVPSIQEPEIAFAEYIRFFESCFLGR